MSDHNLSCIVSASKPKDGEHPDFGADYYRAVYHLSDRESFVGYGASMSEAVIDLERLVDMAGILCKQAI